MKSTADSKIKNGEPCKPRVWPLIQGGSLPGGQDLIYIQEAFYFLSVMGRSIDIFFRALRGFPDSSVGKESTYNAGDASSIPGHFLKKGFNITLSQESSLNYDQRSVGQVKLSNKDPSIFL